MAIIFFRKSEIDQNLYLNFLNKMITLPRAVWPRAGSRPRALRY